MDHRSPTQLDYEAHNYWKACRFVRRTAASAWPNAPRQAIHDLECTALHATNARVRREACRLLSISLTTNNRTVQKAAAAAVVNLHSHGVHMLVSRDAYPAPAGTLGQVVDLAAARRGKASREGQTAGAAGNPREAAARSPRRSSRQRWPVGTQSGSDVA